MPRFKESGLAGLNGNLASFVGVSVRRARNACSKCAGRKLRCDGARPCRRCVDAFISDSCRDQPSAPGPRQVRCRLQTAACRFCAQSKVACTVERPCRRCIRLDIAEQCVSSYGTSLDRGLSPCCGGDSTPLSTRIPFPSSIRDIFQNWPDLISPFLAVDIAASEKRLARICQCLNWALTPEQIEQVRSRFFPYAAAAAAEKFDPIDRPIEALTMYQVNVPYVLDVIPDGEFARLLYYKVNSADHVVFMNEIALSMFGYSEEVFLRSSTNTCHCYQNDTSQLPFLFKLFHKDSWSDLANCILNYYIYGHVLAQKFTALLMRRDGHALPAHILLHIWAENHNFQVKMTFILAS
uniref:Zn(2)-C6 fungal-type domain-containing protein n=1 Tax=Spongospora subterranea TaxID=70186 RepID=A0A0H5RBS0_9EUKA|eukprot:CRZ11057.1 hypothetical protein [Spongospora subterranea]